MTNKGSRYTALSYDLVADSDADSDPGKHPKMIRLITDATRQGWYVYLFIKILQNQARGLICGVPMLSRSA